MLTACSLAWRSALMRSAKAKESSSISKADTLLSWARSPGEAVSLLHRHKVSVLVADICSGRNATLDLIRAVKRSSPNIVAVI